MRLVLMGDVHLYRLRLWPWHLLSKRILGQVNLWVNRRHRFDRQLVERVIERVEALEPGALLCPGDLTTTALHSEFRVARRVLGDLFDRFPTFVVPGNHDRYTFTATRARRFERYFGDWSAERWPHHARFGGAVHVIGLDATRPNPLFDPGLVGEAQRRRLGELLSQTPPGEHVIVMNHYTLGTPPGQHEAAHHALIDESALRAVLRDAGRPIVYVHGHVHRPWCWRPAEAPNVVVINAGSPTHVDAAYPRGQGLWQLDPAASADEPWSLHRHELDERMQWQSHHVPWPTQPGDSVGMGVR